MSSIILESLIIDSPILARILTNGQVKVGHVNQMECVDVDGQGQGYGQVKCEVFAVTQFHKFNFIMYKIF
jgi:hypothetical protein